MNGSPKVSLSILMTLIYSLNLQIAYRWWQAVQGLLQSAVQMQLLMETKTELNISS